MSREIEKFKAYCADKKLRVTPQRLAAYQILQESVKPLTAYDVLSLMAPEDPNPKPPIAYRALGFLEQHGFAHRIESLNAYVACDVDHLHEGSQFMICDSCGTAEEMHLCSMPQSLDKKIQAEGFTLGYWNVEVHGRCKDC